MVKEERCPACGAGELVQETRNTPYVYKGRKTVLAGISGQWCTSCGEVFLRNGEIDSYMAAMNAFKKEVNATLVDAVYVAAVRKKLNLDQREAANLFGGGVNAFSRYETGKAVPPVALVKLLKILDGHPELLEEVRASGRAAAGST
jgi:HTH-type transcriptional regulator/antitoxin MqsA